MMELWPPGEGASVRGYIYNVIKYLIY